MDGYLLLVGLRVDSQVDTGRRQVGRQRPQVQIMHTPHTFHLQVLYLIYIYSIKVQSWAGDINLALRQRNRVSGTEKLEKC